MADRRVLRDPRDDEALLTRTVGLEDAPENVIKEDQNVVRQAAVDTGKHGAVVRGDRAVTPS